MDARRCLVVVGGSKGGVGKSLVAMALIDFLAHGKGEAAPVLVLDGDQSNSDVAKPLAKTEPKPIVLDLDKREGWMDLADHCNDFRKEHVVVNTGARSLDTMIRYAPSVLASITRDLKRPVSTLWVINAQRDSIELLKDYMDGMAGEEDAGELHVVCNEGEEEGRSFAFYKGTTTGKQFADSDGKTIRIPMLAKRITDLLYIKRHSIHAVASSEQTSFGTRLEMQRWQKVVWKEFDALNLTDGKSTNE